MDGMIGAHKKKSERDQVPRLAAHTGNQVQARARMGVNGAKGAGGAVPDGS